MLAHCGLKTLISLIILKSKFNYAAYDKSPKCYVTTEIRTEDLSIQKQPSFYRANNNNNNKNLF